MSLSIRKRLSTNHKGQRILSKQHTRRAHGVDILLSSHKDLRRLKREQDEPSIHGHKVWGSSFLIMDYLDENPPRKHSRVLELGCGWGLGSIYCAKQHDALVTGVDADDAVFPFLDLYAEHNGVVIETQKKRFDQLRKKDLEPYDLIIGSDICFWDELADDLFKLIKRAIKAEVGKIIIADPQRSPFTDLTERCVDQFHAECLSWSVDKPRKASGSLLLIENA